MGIEFRWDYTLQDLSPLFRTTPLAHYFANLFAERNGTCDVDTIIRQFYALKEPHPEGYYDIKAPMIILTGSEDGGHPNSFALRDKVGCELKVLPGVRDAFVIKYSMGVQEHLRMHHDVAQVSASIKLNDGFEGGELNFPRQGITNASLAVGDLVAWPSLVTHPHEGMPLKGGTKYALTIWFELPAQLD